MNNKLTSEAKKALDAAKRSAAYHRQHYTGTEHLLDGLLKATKGTASYILADAGVTTEKLSTMIDRLIAPAGDVALEDPLEFSPRALAVLDDADELTERYQSGEIGTEHILLAILQDTECVATRLLHTMGIDIRKMYYDTLTAMGAANSMTVEEFANGHQLGQS